MWKAFHTPRLFATVDDYVLDWITSTPLKKRWFFEERNGNCVSDIRPRDWFSHRRGAYFNQSNTPLTLALAACDLAGHT